MRLSGQHRAWLLAVPLALLALWILRRFIEPIAWASIVAVVTWPLYRRFAGRFGAGTRSNLAALVFTGGVATFVFVPLLFAFGAVVREAVGLAAWAQQLDRAGVAPPAWLHAVPLLGTTATTAWHAVLGVPGGISASLLHTDSAAVLGWAQVVGSFVEKHVFIGFFTVLALFFAYRGGAGFIAVAGRVLEERVDPRAPRYAALAVRAVRATVGGMVVLALFDGVATSVLYAVAGVPQPAVWGAVTGLFAMLPFVGYVVVGGVGIGLAAHGGGWSALAIALAGAAVVFLGDKFIRPLLVGGAMKLNLFWVLVSTIGGFQALGLIGVFIGPVVVALCGEMWREWSAAGRRLRPGSDRTPTLR
jgi:predicted PurR-regulated permease PerM